LLIEEQATEQIIGSAIEVHRVLGLGLLESSYQRCLAREFVLRDIPFAAQVDLPVEYKGIQLSCGYRMDFVVNGAIVVEIKAVDKLIPIFEAQLLTYLKLSKCRVGLIINFNAAVIRNSIIRRVV